MLRTIVLPAIAACGVVGALLLPGTAQAAPTSPPAQVNRTVVTASTTTVPTIQVVDNYWHAAVALPTVHSPSCMAGVNQQGNYYNQCRFAITQNRWDVVIGRNCVTMTSGRDSVKGCIDTGTTDKQHWAYNESFTQGRISIATCLTSGVRYRCDAVGAVGTEYDSTGASQQRLNCGQIYHAPTCSGYGIQGDWLFSAGHDFSDNGIYATMHYIGSFHFTMSSMHVHYHGRWFILPTVVSPYRVPRVSSS